ncbi:uncharacterized protein J8A68_001897 [[Candida] subhashii]|uniref:Clp R domain-containing protein n=1 Tax=[Candida] subhashii TaxID=561895 RepID=A0A8J5QK80_9ASCO|nr:uncharacterized protein J8A68_001897 [[Candida] subhashii]KAG7664602.1 hypothetical protein J8A68_001897 [[Candida] subhashii]
MSSKLFILILILHLITAYPHRIEVFVDPNLPHENTGEQDVVVIDLSDNNRDEFNLSNLASEAKTSLKESSPVLYALKSINDLQTKHFDKLNSRNNTFYFKETNSALYFDNDAKKWTEIKKNDPDNTPKTEFLDWLPISFCLDSRLGSGGLIYRQVKVMLEATSQLNAALVLHTNPVGFLTGLGGILGFKVVVRATNLVKAMGHRSVTPVHLLAVILQPEPLQSSLLLNIFSQTDHRWQPILVRINERLESNKSVAEDSVGFDSDSLEVRDHATRLSDLQGDSYVGQDHFIASILDNNIVVELLASVNLNAIMIRNCVLDLRGTFRIQEKDDDELLNDVRIPENANFNFLIKPELEEDTLVEDQARSGYFVHDYISRFCQDWTTEAENNLLEATFGRTLETDRILRLLCKKRKSILVLVGEKGVGKSSIVKGVTQRITTGNAPSILHSAGIYSLEIDVLCAHSGDRKELVTNLHEILWELNGREEPTVLFIKDVQFLIKNLGRDATFSIFNKAIDNGNFHIILSVDQSTLDNAINIGQQPIDSFKIMQIQPNTVQESINIMLGVISTTYAEYELDISNEIAFEMVKLADKYIADRVLPHSVLELLDETIASAVMKSVDHKLSVKEKQGNQFKKRDNSEQLCDLDGKMKGGSTPSEDHAVVSTSLLSSIVRKIGNLFLSPEQDSLEARKLLITHDDILDALSALLGIPKEDIFTDDEPHDLEVLEHNVFGQSEAIIQVLDSLGLAKSGILPTSAVRLFFSGPPGCGKTELAMQLAIFLNSDASSFLELDFQDPNNRMTYSKLLGSAFPSKDDGILCRQLKKFPNSVILFRNADPISHELQQIIIEIFNNLKIQNAKNIALDFSEAILIISSNMKTSDEYLDEVRECAVKENQTFDSVIKFNDLHSKAKVNILKKLVEEYTTCFRSQGKNISLSLDHSAVKFMCTAKYDERLGAKVFRKVFEDEIIPQVRDLLLRQSIHPSGNISITLTNDKFIVS